MPKIDCWRLLGISPDAGPAEVRAAFARRASDVHPDGGGTGDGLTLRLLTEARDEALAYLSGRTEGRHSTRPSRRRSQAGAADPTEGRAQADGADRACASCGRLFPHERLQHQLMAGGILGRAGSTMALVCRACATRAQEQRRNRRFIAAAVCVASAFLLGLTLL